MAIRGNAMPRYLPILLLPLAFAGCSVGTVKLPMTLGPSEIAPKASCLTYGDAPAYGDCHGPNTVSVPDRGN
jgi:hypothetical protein